MRVINSNRLIASAFKLDLENYIMDKTICIYCYKALYLYTNGKEFKKEIVIRCPSCDQKIRSIKFG